MPQGPPIGNAEAVVIAPYDPFWPRAFALERTRIEAELGDAVTAVEHVGSTAVPGLGAKPIIDIMIGVSAIQHGERCIEPLMRLGYDYRGEAGIPGRLYFRKLADGSRTHHIHLVEQGCDFWERHLLFRDHLRRHRHDARRYEILKRRLAARFGEDRIGYTEGKTAFIDAALARARSGAG
jgi:GrpB-like predicted nucleotidyltransferase (UPF0157 family)